MYNKGKEYSRRFFRHKLDGNNHWLVNYAIKLRGEWPTMKPLEKAKVVGIAVAVFLFVFLRCLFDSDVKPLVTISEENSSDTTTTQVKISFSEICIRPKINVF